MALAAETRLLTELDVDDFVTEMRELFAQSLEELSPGSVQPAPDESEIRAFCARRGAA